VSAAGNADTPLALALSLVAVAAAVAALVAALAPRVVAALPPLVDLPELPRPVEPGELGAEGIDDRSGRVDIELEPRPAATPSAADSVQSPVVERQPVDWAELAATRGLAGWCALTAALAAGSVAWVLGDDPSLPAWTALCVAGTWLAWIDWRTRLLPKRLVLPTYAVVGVALLTGGLVSGDTDALIRAGVGWLATFGVYAGLWLLHPRGLGYGDVRLSGVLGMTLGWIGWSALLVGAYAGFLLGAVIGGLLALARVVDRRGYPFGPFMLAGAWLGAVTSPLTAGWV
jgi:leader peptidase (prepilin peptidase)/N-methyltransferase